jgi:hypothetical protein
MESQDYSPELLAQLALKVLRKEKTVSELFVEYAIPEWVLTESLVKLVQWSYLLTGSSTEISELKKQVSEKEASNLARLCFVHIEKTAGTSLSNYLNDSFSVDEICPALTHNDLVDLAMSHDLKQYNLLHGHFYLSWLNTAGLDFGNTHFITVLRHPLKRQISSNSHWMRDSYNRNYQSHLVVGHNVQCMRLSPLSTRHGFASTRNHLDAAKQAIEDFYFVGIQERFNESLSILARLLGQPEYVSAPRLNVSKSQAPTLPRTLQDEIMSANWADMELYEYAVSLFDRKFSGMSEAAGGKACFGHAWTEVDEIKYRMDQPMYGNGWHFREGGDNLLPQIIRWTGPGTESTLSFQLNPERHYRLAIRVVNALTPGILESLTVFVNGTVIETQVRLDDQWGHIFEGIVPRTALLNVMPNTKVILRVDMTEQFKHIDPKSIDDRYCGVAVSEINFTPLDMAEPPPLSDDSLGQG